MMRKYGLLSGCGFLLLGGFFMSGCCREQPCGDGTASLRVGSDVASVFARARAGKPLRYVALGGSITQSGKGWIGPWLKAQFPKSQVSVVNSGMSATGSALGIFRVERDVISHQPDLVAIEYCVNDGGLTDAEAVRYMESLVVRLKELPHPPAIIIVEAAAENGVNLARHRRVARHYGLLEIDMQQSVERELKESAQVWSDLFGDSVHPNEVGNAFYARVMETALTPYLFKDGVVESGPLPEPISERPLILDGRMVPLSARTGVPGWRTESSVPFWWDRFFDGILCANDPGAVLEILFRGRAVGLFFAMDESYGTFHASVDGGAPIQVATNTRGGYSYRVLADDLPGREHRLTVALPPESDPVWRQNGPVKLGYLLMAGADGATAEPSPQGTFSPADLKSVDFSPLQVKSIRWAGSYPIEDDEARDARAGLDQIFPPEQTDGVKVKWKPWPDGVRPHLDFWEISGSKTIGVSYVSASVDSEFAGEGLLAVAVDYYVKIRLNGEWVSEIRDGHGSPNQDVFIPIQLKQGKNDLLIKVAAGSLGHKLVFSLGAVDSNAGKCESTSMNAKSETPQGATSLSPTYANVRYGPNDRQVMDVWLAKSRNPTPCVIFIHGGGWVAGDKSNIAVPGGPQAFLDAGISFVSINYRYLPQTIIDKGMPHGTAPIQPRGDYAEAPVKRPLYDAARALQMVRSLAGEWNMDPARIGLTGGSAGACTSLWLAFHDDLADPSSEDPVARQSTKPWCVAVQDAQTTLDPVQMKEWIPNAIYGGHAFGYVWDKSDFTVEFRSFLADWKSVEPWIHEYSPYSLVTPDDPPVYLQYSAGAPERGTEVKDPTHSSNFGAILEEKLKAQGNPYEWVHADTENPEHGNVTEYLIDALKR